MRASLFFVLMLAGCQSAQMASPTPPAAERYSFTTARQLAIVDGVSGEAMSFADVVERAAEFDVVIIGEQHDDAMGHAFQGAYVEAVFARWPGSVLALEMLERDEQALMSDFADGIVELDDFVERTGSAGWGGEADGWYAWYQPTIDAALANGGRVVAGNAPRRYVRLARTDGYERLESLDESRRSLYTVPPVASEGRYVDRFRAFIAGINPEEMADDGTIEDWTDEDQQRFESVFRAQSLWDATMAESIAVARHDGAVKVVQLIGQFHSDFDGGVVQQLRHMDPDVRILVISMQTVDASTLREEDADRADVVVYTSPADP